MSARQGIALPMVLLVSTALAVLASLAAVGALQAWRVTQFAEDALRAEIAAVNALRGARRPGGLEWLCLQPKHVVVRAVADSSRLAWAELRWRHLGSGLVRVEVDGVGVRGSRQRRALDLRPDSLPPPGPWLGCPGAVELAPAGEAPRIPVPMG